MGVSVENKQYPAQKQPNSSPLVGHHRFAISQTLSAVWRRYDCC